MADRSELHGLCGIDKLTGPNGTRFSLMDLNLEWEIDMTITVLDFLNDKQMRATYGAVAKHLSVLPRSDYQVGGCTRGW